MRRVLGILSFLLLVPFFIFVSNSIVNVSKLQLSMQLMRQQILNYELSSRMIEARFRQLLKSKDDYSTEIKLNVLESSVMNFDEGKSKPFQMTPSRFTGFTIINLVRRLSFQPPLELEKDQDILFLLQYAFYLERNRRYSLASEKYDELEKTLQNTSGEDLGFVLLHNGYSLALLGKTDQALNKLSRVQDLYQGTHYSDTATVLIRILLDNRDRVEKIEKTYTTKREQGVALYKTGQYAEAVKRLEAAENLEVKDRYVLSRSYEETGSMKNAIKGYVDLTRQREDEEVAKQANRRLLIIGKIYGGGEKMSEVAEKKAKELGDEKVVKEVNEGASLQLKPVVVEKIKERAEEAKKNPDKTEEQLAKLEEIQKELAATLTEDRKEYQELVEVAPPPEPEKPPEVKPEKIEPQVTKLPAKLVVEFIDRRQIIGDRIEFNGKLITIHSGGFNTTLPYSMLENVMLEEGENVEREKRIIQFSLKDGTKIKADALHKLEDRLIIEVGKEERPIPPDSLRRALPVDR